MLIMTIVLNSIINSLYLFFLKNSILNIKGFLKIIKYAKAPIIIKI